MALTHMQYDEIMRTYEEKQNKSRHLLEQRKEEVYARIPEYKALDSACTSIRVMLISSINTAKKNTEEKV